MGKGRTRREGVANSASREDTTCWERTQSRTRKDPSQMDATIATPGMATRACVEQFNGDVERWVSRQPSQAARVPADPKGPGRPCALPAAVLWSRVWLCVLHRARGVRWGARAMTSVIRRCRRGWTAAGPSRGKRCLSTSANAPVGGRTVVGSPGCICPRATGAG
jgi:hypothetical protein